MFTVLGSIIAHNLTLILALPAGVALAGVTSFIVLYSPFLKKAKPNFIITGLSFIFMAITSFISLP